jgi:hypothetical protein
LPASAYSAGCVPNGHVNARCDWTKEPYVGDLDLFWMPASRCFPAVLGGALRGEVLCNMGMSSFVDDPLACQKVTFTLTQVLRA